MVNYNEILETEETLDPSDWEAQRLLAHRMIDDVFSFVSGVREQPAWQPVPEKVKDLLQASVPAAPTGDLTSIYERFKKDILPYRKGSIHPMFFSWVEGNGTITGVLADMLASTMNSNLAIGDHSAVYVERQVIEWMKQWLGFPATASGIFTGGGSVANVTALIVARNAYRDGVAREEGLKHMPEQLVVYCSTETHNCVFKAVETIGIGNRYLRRIPVTAGFTIDMELLRLQLEKDKRAGLTPLCLIGNAGTVNTGAIDPLEEMAAICRQESMWFHIDGAIGALAKPVPEMQDAFQAIALADSVAFDLHKWMYVNYEAGCLLVRDGIAHKNAFSHPANYLARHERGLAGGPESFSGYGLELSRSFKSLKIWMGLQEQGMDKYLRLIRQNIAQAFYLQQLVHETDTLEMLTPVTLNIVCYRYNPGGQDDDQLNVLNKELLMRLHESGVAAPSYTILGGRYAIRVSITNHRTTRADLQKLVSHTVLTGKEIMG